MSFIYRDFLTPSRHAWNMASALYHKFDKVWPKTTINGVEVYAERMTYWDDDLRSDIPFKRFMTALGVEYTQLQDANYDGIEKAYFKLKPNKFEYTAPEKSAIVGDLNGVFSIGDEFELYIHYSGESRRVVESHWKLKDGAIGDKISDYTVDTVGIRNTLHSDPMLYFANAKLESAGVLVPYSNDVLQELAQTGKRTSPRATPVTRVEYDEDVTHIYATLALLDNGTTFQQQGSVYSERTTVTKTSSSDVYFNYSYKIKYKMVAEPTVSSYIVDQIDILSNAMQEAIEYKGGNIQAISNVATDTTLKEAVIEMNNVESVGLTYNGYLMVNATAMMKRKDFASMLGKILSTGYKKEKTKWYEKVIAIVIVIVAIVVGIFTYGQGTTPLLAAAQGLAATAAVASIGMMIYVAAFPNATDQAKMIGKFVQIVGLAAMVTGIMAAIQNAWNQAAKQAMQKGAITSTTDYTIKQFVSDMISKLWDSVKSGVMDKVTMITSPGQWSLPSLSDITMTDVGGWLRNIGDGLKMYMKFFGEQKQYSTPTEDEQAVKEDGVESIFLAYEMVDNLDALYRIDNMVKDSLGGQKTENFLVRIT